MLMRQLLLLIVSILVFNSCTFLKTVQTKVFPYKDVDVETLTQTPKPSQPYQLPKTNSTPSTPSTPSTSSTPSTPSNSPSPAPPPTLPSIPREFRAAWIASVANINWPSRPGLSTEEQKTEAIDLLNYLQANNFNAVILQVRPQADALYASSIEPWSYFLTGQQNKAPFPFYDPLSFWIEESHKRGMELHAWLNPYRAHHTTGKNISEKSIVRTNPEQVHLLKEGFWWMDPSLKSTQDRTSKVVIDIVKRYDIDGIHFDDYFYPYPSYNGDKDFPDHKSWNEYLKNGGDLSRGDWRRESVNILIERLYKEIKAEKKYVKFGISPFGIYRPGYPASVKGFDQYDKLYADARLWLNKGWIDYFTPQLYWPINKPGQSFPVLLAWWQQENKMQRHLWPGISIGTDKYGITDNKEVLDQIKLSRTLIPKSQGVVHWNISSLTKNPTLTQELKQGPYKVQALIPTSTWLNSTLPTAPRVTIKKTGESINVIWNSTEKETFRWVVYSQYDNKWEYEIKNKEELTTSLKLKVSNGSGSSATLKNIVVTAIDRTGNESAQTMISVE
jgi:uncharacterized lipoprotein YddW (UPF0748 family)